MASDSEGEVFCDTLEQMEPEQVTSPGAGRPQGGLGSLHTVAETSPAGSPAPNRQLSASCCHLSTAFLAALQHPKCLPGPR